MVTTMLRLFWRPFPIRHFDEDKALPFHIAEFVTQFFQIFVLLKRPTRCQQYIWTTLLQDFDNCGNLLRAIERHFSAIQFA